MRLLQKMVEWIQLSSVRFRFLLVFLLSLMMVLGSSQATEIQCPSGLITIISTIHDNAIEKYQREAGTDSTKYNTTSSEGYCKAKITISVCTVQGCRLPAVETTLEFNKADGAKIKDENIHFNPSRNHLEASFGFKALGSYVDQIEEAAKNITDAQDKSAADKLVAQLRFVKNEGFSLDPPRSKKGDWEYAPNLLAPPRTTSAVATSKASTTASRSSRPGTKATSPLTTIKPQDCPKCDCSKGPLRDSSAGAAAQGANGEESGQKKSTEDDGEGYIIGMIAMVVIAVFSLLFAVIFGIKLRILKKDIKADFENAIALEQIHLRAAKRLLSELRMLEQIQQEIQDAQPNNSNREKFKEMESKMKNAFELVEAMENGILRIRNEDQQRRHDELVEEIDSGAVALTIGFELNVEEEEKGKDDQKSNVKSQNKAESAPKSKAESAPKSKAEAAPKSKTEAAPKSKAEAAPKSKTEGAPKSKADAAPKSKAEGVPKSKTEGAPKSKTEAAPKSKAEGVPKSKAEGVPKSKTEAVPK